MLGAPNHEKTNGWYRLVPYGGQSPVDFCAFELVEICMFTVEPAVGFTSTNVVRKPLFMWVVVIDHTMHIRSEVIKFNFEV